MKKKAIAAILAVILAFPLSAAALAAKGGGSGGTAAAVPSAGNIDQAGKPQQLALRARINKCLAAMRENQAETSKVRARNMQLGAQLRVAVNKLKVNGAELSEETLDALDELKTQLSAKYDELSATKEDIKPLLAEYRECRRAGDFEKTEALLNQIMEIQETRLQLMEEISRIIQEMTDLIGNA